MPLDDWLPRVLPLPGAWPLLDALMLGASTLGLVALVLGVPWGLRRRAPLGGRAAALTLLASLPLTLALQQLVMRPRPAPGGLALLPAPPLPAFPSGHAVLAAVAVVVMLAHRRRLGLALLPVAALVAVSRVHLRHHHFTDVIGGGLLGVGLALGALTRARAPEGDPWRLRWLVWPQLGLVLAVTLVAYTGAFSAGHAAWLRIPAMDKVMHFVLFGLLALTVHFATRGRTLRLGPLAVPVAILVPMLGALLEELGQAWSPHRTFDQLDLLADLLGMLAFTWLGRVGAPAPLGSARGP